MSLDFLFFASSALEDIASLLSYINICILFYSIVDMRSQFGILMQRKEPGPGTGTRVLLNMVSYMGKGNIFNKIPVFYPTALKGCRGIVFTHGVRMGGRSGGQREIVCPGYISETVRCRKFILGRDIGWGV